MDSIWTFIQNMTLWNWLALIAFIFFPLSALNAFLSLKSRYRDWRGIRSKKSYKKRLDQLETLVNTIGTYRNEPRRYFFVVIDYIATTLLMSLEASICLVLAFVGITIFESNGSLTGTLLICGLVFVIGAIFHANRLLWLARHVHVPDIVKDEVLKFLAKGAKKGLTHEEGVKDLIRLLFHHHMITSEKREQLEKLVDNSP